MKFLFSNQSKTTFYSIFLDFSTFLRICMDDRNELREGKVEFVNHLSFDIGVRS